MSYATMTWVEPFAADRKRRRSARLDFSRRYGVRRMSASESNILKFLDAARPATPDQEHLAARRDLLAMLTIGDARADKPHPFHRLEIWGRDRKPLFLVGHPQPSLEFVHWSPGGFPILGIPGATFAATITGANLGSWWSPIGWSGLHAHLVIICDAGPVQRACGEVGEPAGVRGSPVADAAYTACRICGCSTHGEPEYVGYRVDDDSAFAPACSVCVKDKNADWRLWGLVNRRLIPTG